jgi:hypothetical protein
MSTDDTPGRYSHARPRGEQVFPVHPGGFGLGPRASAYSAGMRTRLIVAAAALALAAGGGGIWLASAGSHGGSSCEGPTCLLHVAPSGDDANACTEEAPCLTFDRAYHAAAPGQTVEVAAGKYPEQKLTYDATKTSPDDVVFRPAPGANVVTRDIILGTDRYTAGASHVTFRGLAMSGWLVEGCGSPGGTAQCASGPESGGDDVSFVDDTVRGGVFVNSATNVSMIGGSVGPGVNYHPDVQNSYLMKKRPRNILFDGVLFHDWTRTAKACDSSGLCHVECLQISSGDYITIRNSRFRHCDIFDVHMDDGVSWGTGFPTHVTVENNFFAASTDGAHYPVYYALSIYGGSHVLVRNNSWVQQPRFPPRKNPARDFKVVGNLGPYSQPACDRRISYAHNVWLGARCGATDRRVSSLGFRRPGALDLHLLPGSPGIDAGDPASFPATDIDGRRRPTGKGPDAGAVELG